MTGQYGNGVDVIKFLLRQGADITARTLWGDTAAHCAALYSGIHVMQYLIEQGCPVSKESK